MKKSSLICFVEYLYSTNNTLYFHHLVSFWFMYSSMTSSKNGYFTIRKSLKVSDNNEHLF